MFNSILMQIILRQLCCHCERSEAISNPPKSPFAKGGQKGINNAIFIVIILLSGFFLPTSAEAYYLYVTDGSRNRVVAIDSKNISDVKEIEADNALFDIISAKIDGRDIIILSHAGNKGIWVINSATFKVEKKIPFPREENAGFFHLAYNPLYKKLYAVSRALKEGYVFDSDWRHIKTIKLEEWPSGISIRPDGRYAYATNMMSKSISVINSQNDRIERTIKINGMPNAIAFSPDGKYLYVTDEENFKLFILDADSEKVIKELIIGIAPRGITVTPDGKYVYVSNLDSFSVTAIDANTMEVIANIPVSSLPSGIAASPDGKRVYVCNYYDSSISIIDSSSNREIERIYGMAFPTKIAVSKGE